MAQGEVVRFRMLNGSSDNLMPVVVQGHDVHLLAMDGVNLKEPRAIPPPSDPEGAQLLLAPANRAEFLVKAVAKPGVYQVLQRAQTQQFLFSAQKVIAELEVTSETKNMSLPSKLPEPTRYYPLLEPSQLTKRRTLVFDGKPQPPGTLQDTIWVPMKSTVVIRMKFKEFAGKLVYHCHILPHEDTGMMQNFLIL